MLNDGQKCAITTTLSVIDGKWKAVILWHLIERMYRFNEIKHLIPDITHKVLTQQLRELEADGIIQRKVYAEVPPRVEYLLTAFGKTLIPVLNMMAQWGVEHEQDVAKAQPKPDAEEG
jgi:DNA-binding HxlR family transcriptional regulator